LKDSIIKQPLSPGTPKSFFPRDSRLAFGWRVIPVQPVAESNQKYV